jgi:hypothetical protein
VRYYLAHTHSDVRIGEILQLANDTTHHRPISIILKPDTVNSAPYNTFTMTNIIPEELILIPEEKGAEAGADAYARVSI